MAEHILDHLEFQGFGQRGDVSNHVPAGEEALLLFVLVHEDGGQIRSGKRDWKAGLDWVPRLPNPLGGGGLGLSAGGSVPDSSQ